LRCTVKKKSLEMVEEIEKKMVKLILEIIRKSKHQQFKLKVTLTYCAELWKTMFEQLLKIIRKSQQYTI